uniref:Amino_oxidase domain-containing protein n=1 Tax=Steinernema glaseri TaxID=37863 RepID=A0A1I7ZQM4_9BILA
MPRWREATIPQLESHNKWREANEHKRLGVSRGGDVLEAKLVITAPIQLLNSAPRMASRHRRRWSTTAPPKNGKHHKVDRIVGSREILLRDKPHHMVSSFGFEDSTSGTRRHGTRNQPPLKKMDDDSNTEKNSKYHTFSVGGGVRIV